MRKMSPWFAALPLLPLLPQCMLSLDNHGPAEQGQSPEHLPHHCNLVLWLQSCRACTGNMDNRRWSMHTTASSMVCFFIQSRFYGAFHYSSPVEETEKMGVMWLADINPNSILLICSDLSSYQHKHLPRQAWTQTREWMPLYSFLLSHTFCAWKGLLAFFLGCLEDKWLPGRIHFMWLWQRYSRVLQQRSGQHALYF